MPPHARLESSDVEFVGIGRRAREPAGESGDRRRIARDVGRGYRLGIAYVVAGTAQHRSQAIGRRSYGIYLYMQSVAGRGPGAALGVLAIAVVAVGTYVSHVVVERSQAQKVQS